MRIAGVEEKGSNIRLSENISVALKFNLVCRTAVNFIIFFFCVNFIIISRLQGGIKMRVRNMNVTKT